MWIRSVYIFKRDLEEKSKRVERKKAEKRKLEEKEKEVDSGDLARPRGQSQVSVQMPFILE